MADLRGKNLDETRQDVITKGAGGTFEDGHGTTYFDPDDKAPLPVIDSDANGRFIKWYTTEHTGWMKCISPVFREIPATEAVGSLYRTASADRPTWTFPSVFSEAPKVVCNTPDLTFTFGTGVNTSTTSSDLGYVTAISRDGTSSADSVRASAEGPFDDTP